MKVVLTSLALPITDEDRAAFAGLEVELVAIDGSTQELLIAGAHDADALVVVTEHISRPVIEALPNCKSISRLGIGYDTIDVEAATEHGIVVTNVPDANYREVATHTIAMALALTRKLPAWDRALKTGGWATFALGRGIRRPDDQVFGLVGLGRIGGRVAAIAQEIGYSVQAYDPALTVERAEELGVRLATFDEVVATSDVLSLHVPLMPSTRGLMNAEIIARMPQGAILLNVSRGGLIDEQALADALGSGHLAGAGLDVFEHEPLEANSPLLTQENALLSPHVAYYSVEAFNETRQKAYADAALVLAGLAPHYPVNHPSV